MYTMSISFCVIYSLSPSLIFHLHSPPCGVDIPDFIEKTETRVQRGEGRVHILIAEHS